VKAEERERLMKLLRGLMRCENMGDLHEQINLLCAVLHLRKPEGNFMDGWSVDDWKRARSG